MRTHTCTPAALAAAKVKADESNVKSAMTGGKTIKVKSPKKPETNG